MQRKHKKDLTRKEIKATDSYGLYILLAE